MSEQPKRKFGGKQPGAGRKSKAEEFGLADLLFKAWPRDKQLENIRHIASLIGPAITIKKDPRTGREDIELTVPAQHQIAALRLLLEYGYGKPKSINDIPQPPDGLDLNADVSRMTEEERAVYQLRLDQYIARVRAAGGQ